MRLSSTTLLAVALTLAAHPLVVDRDVVDIAAELRLASKLTEARGLALVLLSLRAFDFQRRQPAKFSDS